MILASLIILLTAFYSIGVVEKSSTNKVIDKQIAKLEEKIKSNENESSLIMDEFSSDYEYRTKIVSMLIAQNPTVIDSEIALEELKSLISADEISIADAKGIIKYSTNLQDKSASVNPAFIEYVNDKTFSKTIVTKINEEIMFVSGAARLDKSGIIQIIFTPEKINSVLKYSDISKITQDFPLYKNGSTAIIDSESLEYLSHTNSLSVGLVSQFSNSDFDFENLSGSFYDKVNGKKSYIKYSIVDNKIIMGIVPKSEMFAGRNLTCIWLLVSLSVITAVSYLSSRAFCITKNCGNP